MGSQNRRTFLHFSLVFFALIALTDCNQKSSTNGNLSSASLGNGSSSVPSSPGSPPASAANFATCPLTPVIPYGTYKAPGAASGPTLTVNAQPSGLYPISRDIYGWNNGGDPSQISSLRIPVQRWGGDATSRYNWKVDSSNAGFDWYFMGGNGQTNPVPNATVDAVVKSSRSINGTYNGRTLTGKAVITLPMVGYLTSPSQVSLTNLQGLIKDGILTGRTINGTAGYVNSTAATNCSFPQNLYGSQQSYNPYVHPNGINCGNSISSGGTQLVLNEAQKLANHIYTSPAWNQSWVQYLTQTYGTAAKGGIPIYQLDNEPSGWSNTHRDVRPETPTGAELIQMALLHAPVIKSADPTALILGPSDYGYQVYGTGMGGNYAPQYLQAMATYQQQNGTRLLDYFDEHYYPFESGVALVADNGSATTEALRLQSTRGLWDPTYPSPVSWIPQALQVIPMFRNYISTYYPGTKIAITEYNFGAPESINGALAEADVLGIFAREKLDLATMWSPPAPPTPPATTVLQPIYFAFSSYLNYDGNGTSFGDSYAPSQSSNQSQLSVYSALRSCDGAVTIMVINKTGGALVSPLALNGFSPGATAQVYNYSGANLSAIVRQADMPVTSTGFTASYPANSITLIVVPSS